jgi:hypothetical protein
LKPTNNTGDDLAQVFGEFKQVWRLSAITRPDCLKTTFSVDEKSPSIKSNGFRLEMRIALLAQIETAARAD